MDIFWNYTLMNFIFVWGSGIKVQNQQGKWRGVLPNVKLCYLFGNLIEPGIHSLERKRRLSDFQTDSHVGNHRCCSAAKPLLFFRLIALYNIY